MARSVPAVVPGHVRAALERGQRRKVQVAHELRRAENESVDRSRWRDRDHRSGRPRRAAVVADKHGFVEGERPARAVGVVDLDQLGRVIDGGADYERLGPDVLGEAAAIAEDRHLAGVVDGPGLAAVCRMGHRQPADLVEVAVEREVVPDVVQVAVARAGRQRVLVRGVEEVDGRRRYRRGGREGLASVGRFADTDQQEAGVGVDGESRVVEAAAAVGCEPWVAEVDVPGRVGDDAAVGEGLAAIGGIRISAEV